MKRCKALIKESVKRCGNLNMYNFNHQTCKDDSIPLHKTSPMLYFKWIKIVDSNKAKGRFLRGHSAFGQVSHLLLAYSSMKLSADHTPWHNVSNQGASYPVFLMQPWKNVVPTTMTHLFMGMLLNEIRNVKIFSNYDRMFGIFGHNSPTKTSANSQHTTLKNGIQLIYVAASFHALSTLEAGDFFRIPFHLTELDYLHLSILNLSQWKKAITELWWAPSHWVCIRCRLKMCLVLSAMQCLEPQKPTKRQSESRIR